MSDFQLLKISDLLIFSYWINLGKFDNNSSRVTIFRVSASNPVRPVQITSLDLSIKFLEQSPYKNIIFLFLFS